MADGREDIPATLARFCFIAHLTRAEGLAQRDISPGGGAMFRSRRSGKTDMRQWRNVIERALILGDGSGPIEGARSLPTGQDAAPNTNGRTMMGATRGDVDLRRGARSVRA
ncbi:MAG: hypothetical protein U5N55_10905 [Cypionkella sp.]|nr:hypothetical protein [Cypionkella sp.]